MLFRCCVILLGLVSIASFASAEDATWGNLEGRFQIDRLVEVPPIAKAGNPQIRDTAVCAKLDVPDETLVVNAENLGVGNIFVFLRKAPAQIHPDLVEVKEPAILKFENCRIVPHVMAIRTGQPLRILMDDNVAHSPHFNPIANSDEGYIVQPVNKEQPPKTFPLPETLPVKVTCDIHSWMNGYVTVLDHPYCAITDKDGKFRMDKLPAGPHTFCVWHERCGYVIREWQVMIEPGQTTTMPAVKVTPEKLKVTTAPESGAKGQTSQ